VAYDIDDELTFKNHAGYVFHDSRGFEAGGEDKPSALIFLCFICAPYTLICRPAEGSYQPAGETVPFRVIKPDQGYAHVADA